MTWTETSILGKNADAFVPVNSGAIKGVVLFLHGYDGFTLRDNEAFTRQLIQHGLVGLCPHGNQCWWTDAVYELFDPTINPVKFLAEQIPDFCRTSWQIEPPHIGVCGVEMGGQGALQLAYRHARQFPAVVAISPKVDFDSWWGHGTSLDVLFSDREAARQRTATLNLHPLNYPKHQLLLCDPADMYCFDGVQTLVSKLSSTGIPFDYDFETSHGGFGWNYYNAMASRAISYLADKLRTD